MSMTSRLTCAFAAVLALTMFSGCHKYVAMPGGRVEITKLCDNATCGVEGHTFRANPDNAPLYAEKLSDRLGRSVVNPNDATEVWHLCSGVTDADFVKHGETKGTRKLSDASYQAFSLKLKAAIKKSVDAGSAKALAAAAPQAAAAAQPSTSSSGTGVNVEAELQRIVDEQTNVVQNFEVTVYSVNQDRLDPIRQACGSPPPSVIRSVALVHADGTVGSTVVTSLNAKIDAWAQAGVVNGELAAALKSNIKEEVDRTVTYGGYVIVFGTYP